MCDLNMKTACFSTMRCLHSMCKLSQQVLTAGNVSAFTASNPAAFVSYQVVYLVYIIVCQFLNSVCHSVLVIVRDISITSKPAYLLHNLPPHISHGYLAFLTCIFQLPFIALMFSMGGACRQCRHPSSSLFRIVNYICFLYQIACKVQITGMHIYLLQSFLLELPAQ